MYKQHGPWRVCLALLGCLALLMVGCAFDDSVSTVALSLEENVERDELAKRARYYVLVPGDYARNGGTCRCTTWCPDDPDALVPDRSVLRPDSAGDSVTGLYLDSLVDTMSVDMDTIDGGRLVRTVVYGDSLCERRIAVVDTLEDGPEGVATGRMVVCADSVYYTTVTDSPAAMLIGGEWHELYPQRVYCGPTRDTTGRLQLTRYLSMDDSAVTLRLLVDTSGRSFAVDPVKVIPHMVRIGDSWPTAPMLWDAGAYAREGLDARGYAVADTFLASTVDSGSTTGEVTPYRIGSKDYAFGLIVKGYYVVTGVTVGNVGPLRSYATVAVDDYYFKDAGLCKQRIREVWTRETGAGAETLVHRTVMIDRGGTAARIFPD